MDPDPQESWNAGSFIGAIEGRGRTMEVWRLKMESWTVWRPVVADSHYFDKIIKSKVWIRIRI